MSEEITLKDIVESNFREHGEKLDRIETQVLKTNGRVSTLEGRWAMLRGAWITVTVILLPVVFLLANLYFRK